MKRYEKHLLIGTIFTFMGIFIIYKIGILVILGWSILLFGKVLIILSLAEYVDYKRAFRGEDLSQDPKYKKMLRQIRKKYY